ncbi:MAG: hypothetical protein CL666_11155 [Balneola sp.]|nr:hypothetical protein [Balneola sp.]
MTKAFLPTLAIVVLLISGCFPDNNCDLDPNLNVSESQLQADIEAIETYLEENNIDAQVHSSGLRYVINEPGDGDKPTLCDQVTVRYEGRLMSDGSVFDGTDQARAFGLNRLITGWQIGIPLIEKGGSITLYIPSVYGYGSRGSGDTIPPNSNLIFDIELAGVF